jgi:hypothetical protein
MIPFISAVGEAIASKPTLNTNCGVPNTNSGIMYRNNKNI